MKNSFFLETRPAGTNVCRECTSFSKLGAGGDVAITVGTDVKDWRVVNSSGAVKSANTYALRLYWKRSKLMANFLNKGGEPKSSTYLAMSGENADSRKNLERLKEFSTRVLGMTRGFTYRQGV